MISESSWRDVKIGDACELSRETWLPDSKSHIPYIGLEHIGQGTLTLVSIGDSSEVESIKLRFKKGQILFGKLRPYFKKVIQAKFDGICSSDIFVIQAKRGFDNGFIRYLFSSDDLVAEATRSSEGTRMPRASWDYLAQLSRPMPKFDEQVEIAKILDDIGKKIDLNNEMKVTLEEMGQTIFKRWFFDFEFPDANGKPYKSSGGKMVDSDLGPIPSGWSVQAAASIFKLEYGWHLPEWDRISGHVPVFGSGGLSGHHNKSFVTAPCVIVGRAGKIGPQSVYYSHVDCCPLETAYYVSAKPAWMRFIFYLIRTMNMVNTGSSVPNLSRNHVHNAPVVVPSETIIKRFDDLIATIFEMQHHNSVDMMSLAQMRDTLLPKLMNGSIRVNV